MGALQVKHARAEDHWRRATSSTQRVHLGLTITNKPPVPSGTMELPPGLTVVYGLNGVGKSSLLRLIECSLNPDSPLAPDLRLEFREAGEFEARLRIGDEVTSFTLSSPSPEPKTVVIDAFDTVSKVRALRTAVGEEDITNGVEPRVLDESDLRLARYVTTKAYDWVEVYEVELPTTLAEESEQVVLYTRVSVSGLVYDSFAMGLGELAAMGALYQLIAAPLNAVVILEEPENFLSSRSTVAIADVLVRQIEKRKLYGIIATHSADLLVRVPIENSLLLQTGPDGGSVFRRPASRAELGHALGAYVAEARFVFTEDRMARRLTLELLAQGEGVWGQSVTVAETGNTESVKSLCRHMPGEARMRVVGVLDGDQRAEPLPTDLNWPILFLPTDTNPDDFLRAAALSNVSAFATSIDRTPEVVSACAQAHAGADEHDWFPDMAAALNVDEIVLARGAIHVWLGSDEGAALANEFITALVKLLGR